ncbi:hypothetical protein CHS0354_000455 [Potamilus streckersoni]|uniref:Orotidine 5'-phosphate decarboxylase n=1 Tax=Potamilus streckersoni TaxID=2493646 RepID=A0AAE0T6M8_9BIVA|nr:hypothetical protein CHS0354_000455 [Potamilus streckersoni]
MLSRVEIFSELKNLKKIRECIDKDARVFLNNEKDVYSLVVSVDELCSNIIRHAYLGKDNERIILITSVDESFFFIAIEYFGKGFDQSSYQFIPVDQRQGTTKKGRFGLKLLEHIIKKKKTPLCVGLDPDLTKIPILFHSSHDPIAAFTHTILETVAPFCAAIKPNFAFYEAEGIDGLSALKMALSPKPNDLFIIGDVKRADIANSSSLYAKAFFDYWQHDAVTVHPYMGMDSILPFLSYSEKLTFILCLTSNHGSTDIQEQPLANGKFVYEHIASLAMSWNKNKNVGLVVGATKPNTLAHIQNLTHASLPLLIPGIGSQGSSVASLQHSKFSFSKGLALFNQSRSIIYPEGNFQTITEFQDAVQQKVIRASNELRNVMGWS